MFSRFEVNKCLFNLIILINCSSFYRVDDLWERLNHCYDAVVRTENGTLSFKSLKTLLWLALSLENVDNDEEVKDIKVISFGEFILSLGQLTKIAFKFYRRFEEFNH